MPRFIAVHPVAFTEAQLQELGKVELPVGASWLTTFRAVDENKTFCEWESPTKVMLADGFDQNSVPYEAIYEVHRFDPATGTFEAPAKEPATV